MRIAIPYSDGMIYWHFGQGGCFKLYDIVDKKLIDAYVINCPDKGHEQIADFLSAAKVQAVICGGIGAGAYAALLNNGIIAYAGVKGDADKAIGDLIAGTLKYDRNATCFDADAHCAGSCDSCSGCSDEAGGCSCC